MKPTILSSAILSSAMLLAALSPITANASDNWQTDADISIEGRLFIDDPKYIEQDGNSQFSLLGHIEWQWQGNDDRHSASFIPFARVDSVDSERSHVDLREAYWAFEGDTFEVLVGLNKVFWGVTESRHIVDIVNQTDAVEDFDQEEKLGQPMVQVGAQLDWGKLDFYVLPYFRERTFSGQQGRLREPLVVEESLAQFESNKAEEHVDFALRYSHYFGDVDLGLSYFKGTSREPRLLINDTQDRFIPFYEQIEQVGIDAQYTANAWLWKIEAIQRETAQDSFAAVVAGWEYTKYQTFNTNADLGILVEYLYDGRGPNEPQTPFDDDVLIGARISLNDAQDSSVLAGVVYDPDTKERFYNVEAERRFGDSVKAELRLRAFSGGDKNNPFNSTSNDDYMQLRLSKYF